MNAMRNPRFQSNALALGLPLLAGLSLLSPAAAQGAGQRGDTPAATSRQEAQDSRALKRILHLGSGSTLRVVARETQTGWEYKNKGAWLPVPGAALERVALEKDVLRELRERREALPEGDSQPAAELASWMLQEGLLQEAFGSLDQLLLERSSDAAARRVIEENAWRFRVPELDPERDASWEAIAPLAQWAMQRSASSRELATLELAELRDREGLASLLSQELFQSSADRRTFAALGLRRLFPGTCVRELLSRAVLDASLEVRREASFALRDVGDPAVTVPVVRALVNSPHEQIRSQAAESLGNMGYPAAVAPMIARLASLQSSGPGSVPHAYIFTGRQYAYVQDFDVEVAQFQAIADPAVNVLIEGQVTDAGVLGIKHNLYVHESHSIRSSLQKLTGERPGSTNRQWIEWYKQREVAASGEE